MKKLFEKLVAVITYIITRITKKQNVVENHSTTGTTSTEPEYIIYNYEVMTVEEFIRRRNNT